ncbi:MAG: hypothetical protein JNK10_00460 [Cyclobacteriaceae bacterium]|nr:hypothetical protein [Cyclobacteriaceae bacterium]
MVRFALLTSILTLMLAGIIEVFVAYGYQRPSFATEIIVFLAVVHIGLYFLVSRQIGQRPENFIMIYLGTTVLRILFFGVFVFLLIWMDPENGFPNAVLFLVAYVLFTALEVTVLFIKVNAQKPTNLGQKGG